MFGLVAALIVLPAVIGPESVGAPRRILTWRPLAWLGLISNSIYLWQGSVLQKLWERRAADIIPRHPFVSMAVTGIAVTVGCAAVTYYAVERPALRFKDRGTPRRARPEVAPALAPATGGGGTPDGQLASSGDPGAQAL